MSKYKEVKLYDLYVTGPVIASVYVCMYYRMNIYIHFT